MAAATQIQEYWFPIYVTTPPYTLDPLMQAFPTLGTDHSVFSEAVLCIEI